MGIFIPVDPGQVKQCQLCGQSILFVERRAGGLWFPTDAIQDEESRSWGYMSRGSHKEVSSLHKCYGDPKDPSTVNGRQSFLQGLTQRIENLHRTNMALSEDGKMRDEYKKLIDEYTSMVENFPGIIPG